MCLGLTFKSQIWNLNQSQSQNQVSRRLKPSPSLNKSLKPSPKLNKSLKQSLSLNKSLNLNQKLDLNLLKPKVKTTTTRMATEEPSRIEKVTFDLMTHFFNLSNSIFINLCINFLCSLNIISCAVYHQ